MYATHLYEPKLGLQADKCAALLHLTTPTQNSVTLSSTHPCRYTWRTTEWSDCRVDLLLSQQDRRRSNLTGLCGGGLQTREVYCVQANAELLKYINTLREKDKGKKKGKKENDARLFYRMKNLNMLLFICLHLLFASYTADLHRFLPLACFLICSRTISRLRLVSTLNTRLEASISFMVKSNKWTLKDKSDRKPWIILTVLSLTQYMVLYVLFMFVEASSCRPAACCCRSKVQILHLSKYALNSLRTLLFIMA